MSNYSDGVWIGLTFEYDRIRIMFGSRCLTKSEYYDFYIDRIQIQIQIQTQIIFYFKISDVQTNTNMKIIRFQLTLAEVVSKESSHLTFLWWYFSRAFEVWLIWCHLCPQRMTSALLSSKTGRSWTVIILINLSRHLVIMEDIERGLNAENPERRLDLLLLFN